MLTQTLLLLVSIVSFSQAFTVPADTPNGVYVYSANGVIAGSADTAGASGGFQPIADYQFLSTASNPATHDIGDLPHSAKFVPRKNYPFSGLATKLSEISITAPPSRCSTNTASKEKCTTTVARLWFSCAIMPRMSVVIRLCMTLFCRWLLAEKRQLRTLPGIGEETNIMPLDWQLYRKRPVKGWEGTVVLETL
ncbi:hypothetical protein B0J14DRAFT_695581 [Halenospora varia]|nr:hypothetical protein B0J14DRAFT_695581 [Halenospora varia]